MRAITLCLFAVVLASLVGVSGVSAIDATCALGYSAAQAGKEGKPIGVGWYCVENAGASYEVDVFDRQGKWLLRVLTQSSAEAGLTFSCDAPSGRFEVQFDPLRGRCVLEPATGQKVTFLLDREARRWRGSREAPRVFASYYEELKLISAVHDDLIASRRVEQPQPQVSAQAGEPCFAGMWNTEVGWGTSRAVCCQGVTLNLNNSCNNRWCWGCCRLLPCNAMCVFGDFGCVCDRSGQMCEERPNNWP